MAVHKIKQGLDLPILGEPEQVIDTAPQSSRVAVVALDYPGMKPTMHVKEGDAVRRGQLLFADKKTEGVRYTAPGAGKVVAVNRGAKRVLQTVVIELDEGERAGKADTVRFESDTGKHPAELGRDAVRDLLVESGVWTALRRRPYDKVADPQEVPHSIFVTAMDSHPLTADPAVVLQGRGDDFERGLVALGKLTDGKVLVCTAPGTELQVPQGGSAAEKIRVEHFEGPHPAGTAGVHIHTLDPVDRSKVVWHVGYQDVAGIGKLFQGGQVDVERVVALGGPPVGRPRLLRTRRGAWIDEILRGEVNGEKDVRVISGSVLDGRQAEGEVHGYLGRFDNQISVLEEGGEREFVGWLLPGASKFSTLKTYVSSLIPGKKFNLTTSTEGSHRAIVPLEDMYERIFPFDIEPAYLLKAIVMHDIEQAEALGVMELAEEDVALCSFVCASKNDYGVYLRDVLTTLEKEG